jgi:hypothetical protein
MKGENSMPRINVKLDDVQSGFEIFPDVELLVEVQESSKVKKSDNGPYIMWIGKVIEGEYEDKIISWNTSLQDQALWNLKDMLEKVGIPWDEDGFELEDVFGAILIVQNESGLVINDIPRNNVVAYFAVPDKKAKK